MGGCADRQGLNFFKNAKNPIDFNVKGCKMFDVAATAVSAVAAASSKPPLVRVDQERRAYEVTLYEYVMVTLMCVRTVAYVYSVLKK